MQLRPLARLALIFGIMAAAAGCATPEPTPTPAFATDEVAYAAAEQAIREYTAALDGYLRGDEGADPFRYTTGEALGSDRRSAEDFERRGVRQQGDSTVENVEPLEVDRSGEAVSVKSVACIDISESELLDAQGKSIRPSHVPPRFALEYLLTQAGDRLLIADSEWVEADSC